MQENHFNKDNKFSNNVWFIIKQSPDKLKIGIKLSNKKLNCF